MNIVENLSQTLNGGFFGLYNEVVIEDCYRIRNLDLKPNVVFDLGANVGMFTRLAREVFPDALIIAVEPDPENYAHLVKFTPPDRIVFVNKAIGEGQVWREKNYVNGSGAMFITEGVGFSGKNLKQREMDGSCEKAEVSTITLHDLIQEYAPSSQSYLLKIDIEGNEHSIFSSPRSMHYMTLADYICMEVHLFTIDDKEFEKSKQEAVAALDKLRLTHDVEMDGLNEKKRHIDFWAKKKII